MTARLPADLLDRPAQESSRLLALSYLDQIERAQSRLENPRDTEALHDFRVGLRRLRSCTRAYRSHLKGSKAKQLGQRLRKLTLATNTGRDIEVHLDWLRRQGEKLGPEDTQGLSWLIGRLEGRKHETLEPAAAEVGRQFVKAATKFRPRLATFRVEIGAYLREKQASFGQVTGELIRQQAAELARELKRVRDATNVEEAHRARICIKRLRYLLEPVARRTPRARGLITRLKEAQDLLGTLRDLHLLSDEIASSIRALSEVHMDPAPGSLPGIRTLERLAREQADAAFASFESLWGGERATRFLSRADEVGRILVQGAAGGRGHVPRLTLAAKHNAASTPGIKKEDEERAV